ncbi:integrase/recombinase xerD homolog [Daphnia magna]|uniref:integrase/recombinase xerD homolog n=1 Tax=Daphnia magna TaxID=35525 RepID=UPI001E1BA2EC|nr:integrase/recombinase xerD homolog [Daphnia magna]
MDDRCLLSQLEVHQRLCVPSIQSNRELYPENETGSIPADASLPVLAQPTLVPVAAGDNSRYPEGTALSQRFTDRCERRDSSSADNQRSVLNRVEIIRNRFRSERFPDQAIDLILAGNRPATHAGYEAAWNQWSDWCNRNGHHPLHSSVVNVITFLSDSFVRGKAYSTINVYRSMLSGTLPQVDGQDVGKHPTVVKLMKGIFNSNPPKPKYAGTWDVDVVLIFFKTAPPNEKLSLIQLSRKTAMLLALVTMFRVSELAAINLSSINCSDSGLLFSLSRLRKSQRNGPLFSRNIVRLEDAIICPVAATEAYIKATLPLRKQGENANLFVGSVKPHKEVKGSTIGQWLKKVLELAGVDTSIFSAHSTRGASASKAAEKGVPTDSILKTASWASESTFVRFYRRDIPQKDAGTTVLGGD